MRCLFRLRGNWVQGLGSEDGDGASTGGTVRPYLGRPGGTDVAVSINIGVLPLIKTDREKIPRIVRLVSTDYEQKKSVWLGTE